MQGDSWKQGSVLLEQDAKILNLSGYNEVENKIVIISHDCDLVSDKESFVEIIIAKLLSKSSSQYERAKNPRHLHLKYLNGKENLYLELNQVDKKSIAKNLFNKFLPDKDIILPDSQKDILKQWLAARYARIALPDEFEKRLRKKISNKNLIDSLSSILQNDSEYLVGVFFDLKNGSNELPNEAYSLSIFVVYDAVEYPGNRFNAEEIASEIKALFYKFYGDAATTTEIALEECLAVADTHFSLAQVRRMVQWRLEDISLREEPVGAFMPLGV